jgi:hypothetical protein
VLYLIAGYPLFNIELLANDFGVRRRLAGFSRPPRLAGR